MFIRKLIVYAFLLVISSWAHASGSYNKLFVFGDSLSDTGNISLVLGENLPPPYFMNHITNGPVAVEVLAQ